jgi:hypothetical protein
MESDARAVLQKAASAYGAQVVVAGLSLR